MNVPILPTRVCNAPALSVFAVAARGPAALSGRVPAAHWLSERCPDDPARRLRERRRGVDVGLAVGCSGIRGDERPGRASKRPRRLEGGRAGRARTRTPRRQGQPRRFALSSQGVHLDVKHGVT